MDAELALINKNETWYITDRHAEKKMIGSKWIYMMAINEVLKHKERIVVKGYVQ